MKFLLALCLAGCGTPKPEPYAVWPGKLTGKPLSSVWVLTDSKGRLYISPTLAKELER